MKRAVLVITMMAAGLAANVHVPAVVALAAAETKPKPEYHRLARQLKVTGDVTVEPRIGVTGAVKSVKVLNGNALLPAPVVKTLKGWKFRPFLTNGEPTIATAVLRFNFK